MESFRSWEARARRRVDGVVQDDPLIDLDPAAEALMSEDSRVGAWVRVWCMLDQSQSVWRGREGWCAERKRRVREKEKKDIV